MKTSLSRFIQTLAVLATLTSAASLNNPNLADSKRSTKHLRPVIEKRDPRIEPIVGNKGANILDGDNEQISLQNPDALQPPPTDGGNVVNLKWSFSLSNMLLSEGGFVREQLVTDLPPSFDFAGAQNHLEKGAIRQMHWHDIDEWGLVTNGSVLVSAVDFRGRNQVFTVKTGDVWYFPKGEGHTIQGLEDGGNEYILIFDKGDFNAEGTTFNVGDWILHTPPEVLAKNFGLPNDTFKHTPNPSPSIANGNLSNGVLPTSPAGELSGNESYFFEASVMNFTTAPGDGGRFKTIDSRNFPIAKNIAVNIVEIFPGGLREMHWHPNGGEWLYFQSGFARATVWLGGNNARTFDFSAGDTAIFPDNSGHYIENLSQNNSLFYIEAFKADEVEDFSLTQWLALTPVDLVAQILNVSTEVVEGFKKDKQVIVKGQD